MRNLCPLPLLAPLALMAIVASTPLQSHATSYLWNVASPGANNWNVNANWTPNSGNPGAADTAIFGAVGSSADALTVNNVVSANTAVASLVYTNSGAGVWHVTQIPAGVTLSVNGAASFGNLTSAGALAATTVALYDAGTLVVNGNLNMGNSGSANTTSTVDFSGLSNFVCNAGSGTVFAGIANRSLVTWKLAAASNSITAATLNDNALGTSSSGTANTTLGAGTNIFNVGTFLIGGGRLQCTVAFPAVSTGGLRIRGAAGTEESLCNMTLGNHNTSGSGSTSAGTLSLNQHPVDLKLGTLSLGLSSSGPTGTSPGNGTLSFDTGTVYASNIVMGVSSGTTAFALANGTINVGSSASLTVGPGGISLVNQSAASGAATGTINVTGGSVISSNSIIKTTALGTGTLVVSGGSLTMASGVIGTTALPIDSLSLGDSTLTVAVLAGVTNVSVTTLTMTSTTNNTIKISALPVITSYPVQFPLIRYSSGSSDCVLGSLPPGYVGSLVNGAGSVDLLISSGPITIRPLVWNGTPTGDWNTSTANWLYLGSPTTYAENDFTTLDDSAAGTTTVNLTTALNPGSLTISNVTKNYTINGSGSLSGAVTLVKDGASQLTLANSGVNTFSNGVSILGGTVLLSGSADRLPTGSIVTLADVASARLDLNNLNQTIRSLNGGGYNGGNLSLGTATFTVWNGGTYGGVISGSGQLIKTNLPGFAGQLTLTNANTYTGGTIIGGFTNNTTLAVANQTGSGTGSGFVRVLTNGSLYFGAGGPGGSVAAGVITNDGTVRLNRNDDFTFTNVIVGLGVLQVQNSNTVVINGVNGYSGGTTINPGILRISNPGALGTGPVTVANSAPAVLQLSNNITFTNALAIQSKPGASGNVPNVENVSGTNTVSGPISLTQNGSIGWGFYSTAGKLNVAGSLNSLTGTQTSQNTTRFLVLSGDALGEWSGNIIDPVGGTTNLSLHKEGLGTWILSGSNTYTGPTAVNGGNLLVNGSIGGGTVTVTGGTLGGSGQISVPVTVNSLATLAPGNSIGTLTISNTLTLLGTSVMEVSHSSNDKVRGVSTLSLGGALQVVVVGSLSGGEQFKLFDASSYSGDFSIYDLPALPSPLGWDSSTVAVDGILKVTGGAPKLGVSQAGNVLTFSWTDASYHLQAQTNSLNVGLSGAWGDYPGGGTSPVSVSINPANPTVYFRLKSP